MEWKKDLKQVWWALGNKSSYVIDQIGDHTPFCALLRDACDGVLWRHANVTAPKRICIWHSFALCGKLTNRWFAGLLRRIYLSQLSHANRPKLREIGFVQHRWLFPLDFYHRRCHISPAAALSIFLSRSAAAHSQTKQPFLPSPISCALLPAAPVLYHLSFRIGSNALLLLSAVLYESSEIAFLSIHIITCVIAVAKFRSVEGGRYTQYGRDLWQYSIDRL